MTARVLLLAATAAGFVVPPTGYATPNDPPSKREAGSVTAVRVAAAAGRTEVAIAFSGDVQVTDFSLSAPHRIVIDFEPATLKLMPKLYDGIVRGGITSIRAAQSKPDLVRVVLDMDADYKYVVKRDEASIRLVVQSDVGAAAAPWGLGDANTFGAGSAPPQNTALRDAMAAASAFDTRDAAGNSNIGAVAPPKSSASKTLQQPQQQGRRITITFRDTPLRDVLAQFAVFSGQSIVPGQIPTVLVSAEIIDQPWQYALFSLLQSQGLVAVDEGRGIIRIDTRANLAANAATEGLVQRNLALNYAKAAELAPTVTLLLSCDNGPGAIQVIGGPPSGDAAGGDAGATGAAPPQAQAPAAPSGPCRPRGRVVPEAQTNQLIITEVESRIDSLMAYAASFDVRTPQVNISSKIISIDRTTTNRLGLAYDIGTATSFFNTLAPRTVNGTPQQAEFSVGLGGDAFAGVANAGRQFAGNSALNLIYNTTVGGFSLTALIDALAQENLTDIQVQPSVNTLDKKQAEIFVGDRVAYLITPPTAPGAIQNAAPQIQQSQIGSRLRVTPSISANRTIRLEVAIENSALTSLTEAGPTSSERTATTVVLVQDGETAVIGGLTQTTTTKSRRGIPLLMKLPLIGRMFAENEDIERNSDLIVLITPRILDDVIPPASGR